MLRHCNMMLLFSLPCMLIGQTKPLWLDADVRNLQFSTETYYTGFAEIIVSDGNFTKATELAKQTALGELSERVIVSVNAETKSETKSETTNENNSGQSEKIRSKFVSTIFTNSKTEIAGSSLETYTDKVIKTVSAFVRVRKSDLYIYYKNLIDRNLNKIDSDLSAMEDLISAGKKMSARRKVENAQYILTDISYLQYIVMAINADENVMQTRRTNTLQQIVNQKLIALEKSTYVFLNCLWEGNKNENPNLICGIITQALSVNDCSITNNSNEADYELTLIASTTQRSDASARNGVISYYANLRGTLYNHHTQKNTVEFIIINDVDCYAVGRNAQDAITKAFLLPELKNKIIGQIITKLND